MGLQNFSYFSDRANDWQATSYGDVGACAGIGGGAKHLKLWSPSIKRSVNSLIVHGAVGVEIKVEAPFLSLINGAIQNVVKGKETATAEGNYKRLTCHTSFSIMNYIGSLCAGFEESLAAGGGRKVGGLKVSSMGFGPLFTIPAEVENAWGIGGGVKAFSGVVLGIGTQFYDYNMQQRYWRERNRKPGDPGILDPGKI